MLRLNRIYFIVTLTAVSMRAQIQIVLQSHADIAAQCQRHSRHRHLIPPCGRYGPEIIALPQEFVGRFHLENQVFGRGRDASLNSRHELYVNGCFCNASFDEVGDVIDHDGPEGRPLQGPPRAGRPGHVRPRRRAPSRRHRRMRRQVPPDRLRQLPLAYLHADRP